MKSKSYLSSRTLFRSDPALPLMLFEADGGGASPSPVAPPSKAEAADIVKTMVNDILASKKVNGDHEAALLVLAGKAYANEQRALTAETERDQFKANALDEATKKRLEAYEAHGTPEEIATRMAALETDANDGKQLKLERIATEAGFKPDVLADLAKSKGFRVETREATDANGKTIKTPVAVFKDGEKDVEKPLGEYAESSLGAYLPSLKLEGAPAQDVTLQNGGAWVAQGTGGSGPGSQQQPPVQKPAAYSM